MKKKLAVLLALCMVFALAACGTQTEEKSTNGIVNISSVKNYKEKEKMKNKRRYVAAIVLASIMTSILVAG